MGERQIAGLRAVGRGRECFPGSAIGYGHGHDIAYDRAAKLWRYCDDGTLFTPENERPCANCGLDPKDHGGADPCLGKLPGVRNACCGHGKTDGYIQFDNGVLIEIRGGWSVANGPSGKTDFTGKPAGTKEGS